jgi:pyruvate formate lyase activating enzyme
MICNYCEWRCDLGEGRPGVCQMYIQRGDRIEERHPHHYTTYAAVHIESVPFFHAYPGSRSLQIGSRGCNFDCHYCSNAYVAKSLPDEVYTFHLSPERIVDVARKTGCHNIVFAVNEPIVSFQSLMELADKAKAAGLPLGCMTNGYMTEEAADALAESCAFVNVSLKGFSQEFYARCTGIPDFEPVLRNIGKLTAKTHVEVTTPIIQDVNDQDIMPIAEFLASVNANIPWHVFRLLPEYKMKDEAYPSIELINDKLEEARRLLPYIYFSNFVGSTWVSTYCPSCGEKVIERLNLGGCGGKMIDFRLDGANRCLNCQSQIPIHGRYVKWNSGDEGHELCGA